jgi:hypothetical protein
MWRRKIAVQQDSGIRTDEGMDTSAATSNRQRSSKRFGYGCL